MGAGVRRDAAPPPSRSGGRPPRAASAGKDDSQLVVRLGVRGLEARRPSPAPGGPPAAWPFRPRSCPVTTRASGQSGFRERASADQVVGPGGLAPGEPVLGEQGVGDRIVGGEGRGAGEEPLGLGGVASSRAQPRQARGRLRRSPRGTRRGARSCRSASAHWPRSRASAADRRAGSAPAHGSAAAATPLPRHRAGRRQQRGDAAGGGPSTSARRAAGAVAHGSSTSRTLVGRDVPQDLPGPARPADLDLAGARSAPRPKCTRLSEELA